MRVLCVIPFYKPAHVYGGPTRSVPALCENLEQQGASVTVYTTNANGLHDLDIEPNVRQSVDGVDVYYFERKAKSNRYFSSALAKACRETMHEYDLLYVVANWVYPFIPACRSAIAAGIPYVVAPKNSFNRRSWQGKFLKKGLYHGLFERHLINKASAIHYTTQLEANASSWLQLKPGQLILSNPVSFDDFNTMPNRGQFRNEFDVSPADKLVLYLGRIDPKKGLDLALMAFAVAARSYPQSLFALVGPDENGYLDVLKSLSANLGIENRCIFTGYLDSSRRLSALTDADVFMLTSRYENFGMSAVEAMISGLPVIVSDQVGIADELKREQAGLVVPLEVEAIAVALKKLLGNAEMRSDLGRIAARVARQKYSASQIAATMIRQLTSIISEYNAVLR